MWIVRLALARPYTFVVLALAVLLLTPVVLLRTQVPVNALLFRAEGLRVAVVAADHRAHLRSLTIGRDYGIALEVLDGLEGGEWIVLNPPDSLDEGQELRVSEATTAQAVGGAERVPSAVAP